MSIWDTTPLVWDEDNESPKARVSAEFLFKAKTQEGLPEEFALDLVERGMQDRVVRARWITEAYNKAKGTNYSLSAKKTNTHTKPLKI